MRCATRSPRPYCRSRSSLASRRRSASPTCTACPRASWRAPSACARRTAKKSIYGLDLSGVFQRRASAPTSASTRATGSWRRAEARRLVEAADQAFSWMPAALERLSGVTPIDPGVIDTAFYARTERDFAARPLELLLVADAEAPRASTRALAAMEELAGEPLHLHVVGPEPAGPRPPTGRRSTAGSPRGTAGAAPPLPRLRRAGDPATAPTASRPRPRPRPRPPACCSSPPTRSPTIAISGPASTTSAPGTAGAYADAVRAVLADPGAAAAVAESGAQRVRERSMCGRRRCPPRADRLQPRAHAVRATGRRRHRADLGAIKASRRAPRERRLAEAAGARTATSGRRAGAPGSAS